MSPTKVAGIQCSGQALNLACANRVLILDLWWNSAMEQQAFGRVYRMPQHKETYFGRIMARNTIDERMAELQHQKLKVIGDAIKDHDSSKLTLSLEDIASLLGRPVRDAEGNIVDIVSDYNDEETDREVDEDAGSADQGAESSDSEYTDSD